MNEERQMILKMVKDGKITVEEAEALMDALAEGRAEPEDGEMPAGPPPPERQAEARSAGGEAARGSEQGSVLGEEIRSAVRKALEGVRPAEAVGQSMREVGRVLREELKGLKVQADFSLHDMVRGLFGLVSASEEVEFRQVMSPGGRLVVRNPRGDVRLERGGAGELRVRAVKRVWWRSTGEAQRLLANLQVRAVPRNGDVLLEPVVEGGQHVRYRVDLVAEVPEGVGAEIDVRSGDVRVADLRGDLDVRLASGDLSVGPHGGRVRAVVKSGDVEIAEADGVEVRLASGDLEVGEVRGAAQIQVSSGDVEVRECRGDFDAVVQSGDLDAGIAGAASVRGRVLSGDVDLRLLSLAPQARVGLEVLAGDVDVRVGPDIRAAVRAQATAGGLDWSLPLQNLQRGRGRVEGVLGTPDATIEVRVLSGDLSLGAA